MTVSAVVVDQTGKHKVRVSNVGVEHELITSLLIFKRFTTVTKFARFRRFVVKKHFSPPFTSNLTLIFFLKSWLGTVLLCKKWVINRLFSISVCISAWCDTGQGLEETEQCRETALSTTIPQNSQKWLLPTSDTWTGSHSKKRIRETVSQKLGQKWSNQRIYFLL